MGKLISSPGGVRELAHGLPFTLPVFRRDELRILTPIVPLRAYLYERSAYGSNETHWPIAYRAYCALRIDWGASAPCW